MGAIDDSQDTEVDTNEDDADFMAAFSEDDAAPAPEQPAKPEDAEADAPAGDDENDATGGDVDPDPNADSDPPADADDGADVADPDEHPQVREWEGRRDKIKSQVEEHRAELKQIQADIAAAKQPAEPEPQQDLPDDVADNATSEELGALFTDFPEYRQSIEKLIDQRVAAATGANAAAIEQQSQTIQGIEFAQIAAVHPDFGELVGTGEVAEWIDTLPRKEGNEAMAIYESGTAAQSIELLTRFKQSRQSDEPHDSPKDDVTITRRSRTSAPAPARSRPRKSDDEMFNDAFSKED